MVEILRFLADLLGGFLWFMLLMLLLGAALTFVSCVGDLIDAWVKSPLKLGRKPEKYD